MEGETRTEAEGGTNARGDLGEGHGAQGEGVAGERAAREASTACTGCQERNATCRYMVDEGEGPCIECGVLGRACEGMVRVAGDDERSRRRQELRETLENVNALFIIGQEGLADVARTMDGIRTMAWTAEADARFRTRETVEDIAKGLEDVLEKLTVIHDILNVIQYGLGLQDGVRLRGDYPQGTGEDSG